MKDLVAGRPVFGHPSYPGGLRFRYGRSRVSGFSAFSLHPATMEITDKFIAIGTQLKIEKPTKGGVVSVCDSIDGPIVKLFNGSVKKLKTVEEAKKLYRDVEEIIFLGDILFPFSDLANRNHDLIKAGFVEEWWWLELKEKGFLENLNYFNVDFDKAIELSKEYRVPLHPEYIFYWNQIGVEEFYKLLEWLENSRVEGKIILPYSKSEQEKYKIGKRALELIGLEHDVTIENVVVSKEISKTLFLNLGLDYGILDSESVDGKEFINLNKYEKKDSVLDIINSVSEFEIKDKTGRFIGARMARPEKAKLRKLIGSPNMLFPVGSEGGRLRSVQEAKTTGKIKADFPLYFCEYCKKETIYPLCEICGLECAKKYFCRECGETLNEKCPQHNLGLRYKTRNIDIVHYFNSAIERLGTV
ncbi:MAG: hypothetical protein AABY22_33270, partial [Nanoarchaeota archaeon]